ncbi:MAG TPA: PIN domain nuclease [Spirochaetota bacterium]|nr:PIN domain nuclease [Spirochaetota bacterium]HPJ37655.1 PIN domain nuclease [Spirochaetota bacterium]HPQ53909.1 PIN domain nuclease [Spirochaetota bacterium]
MKVLIDSSIWSLALRRKTVQNKIIVRELHELINEFRVIIIGPIRQEILSGISDSRIFKSLKEKLKAFEDFKLRTEDYEFAAELYNSCRKKGVQGSHTDFLICAVSILNKYPIFTTDKDFDNYKNFIDIELYKIRDN